MVSSSSTVDCSSSLVVSSSSLVDWSSSYAVSSCRFACSSSSCRRRNSVTSWNVDADPEQAAPPSPTSGLTCTSRSTISDPAVVPATSGTRTVRRSATACSMWRRSSSGPVGQLEVTERPRRRRAPTRRTGSRPAGSPAPTSPSAVTTTCATRSWPAKASLAQARRARRARPARPPAAPPRAGAVVAVPAAEPCGTIRRFRSIGREQGAVAEQHLGPAEEQDPARREREVEPARGSAPASRR